MRHSALFSGILLMALTAFLVGGIVVADNGKAQGNKVQGKKASIVVGKIKSEASNCSGGTADGIADMLATALSNTGKFTLPAKGSILSGDPKGNDLVVRGSVTKFDTDAGSGGGLSGLKKKSLGKLGADSKEAKLELKIRVIDVATGDTVTAQKIEASSTDWKSDMTGAAYVDSVAFGDILSKYSDKPMGKAVRAAVAKTIKAIEKGVPEKYYHPADTAKSQ